MRNRSYNGSPGYHVLTPLVLPSGDAVIVNRGFVPLETSGDKPEVPAAPSGVVIVNGWVRSLTEARALRTPRSCRGNADRSRPGRPRAAAAAAAVPHPPRLRRARVVATRRLARTITPLPLPSLDEGPHFSYAIQWFLFCGLAVIGWVLVVRKTAKGGPEFVEVDEAPRAP